MTVWCHLPTIFNRRHALRIAGLIVLCVALITTLFFSTAARAEEGINQTISFQGRLLNSAGSTVPDGYYNIQFKLYQGGNGTTAGNASGTPAGSLKWSETYTNNSATGGVQVKNGYFSVNLGSKTAFGTSVDWNQSTLWISMNVAGAAMNCTSFGTGACTADGEMLPMKRLNATPFSLNSQRLDGKTADNFVQLGQGAQTDASDSSSLFINKTGNGNLLQLQNNSVDVLSISNNGDLTLGGTSDHTISIARSSDEDTGRNLTLKAGDGGPSGGDLVLAGGNATGSDGDGGNLVIDAGTGSGSGSAGEVLIGTTNASGVTIGRTGTTTVILGLLDATSLNAAEVQTNGVSRIDGNGNLSNIGDISATGDASLRGLTVHGDTVLTNGLTIQSNGGTSASFDGSTVQIGDGAVNENLTLLVLDQADAAPGSSNSILGSMYYDTTLGKVQCFEADGWGRCSSSPDTYITVSPEYTNAVMNGIGTGNMTTDLCSDTLNINDGSENQPAICGDNETFNFYRWTSSEVSEQTRSIYVTYQLPSNFKEFISGSTYLMGRTDSDNARAAYQVYRNDSEDGLVACGSPVAVSHGTKTSWQKAIASTDADPASCDFASGDSIVFKISLSAEDNANAYVSNLSFTYGSN
ncbi:MAG: hypothetical protein WBP12_00840 [Candidatus Saccharimonas sp.]